MTEKIYIGFSRRKNNLFSRLIQFFEGTKYSHVYVRKQSKYGEYVYQASGLAVNFTNINTFKEHNEIIYEFEFEITPEQKDHLLRFFISYCGVKYSYRLLFILSTISILRKFGIYTNFKNKYKNDFVCSTLGALIYQKILGLEIPENWHFIFPKDLYKWLS